MPGGFDPEVRYTEDEYLAFSDRTQEKLEMFDGYIRVRNWDPVRMMAGGSVRHTVLSDNLLLLLSAAGAENGCQAFRSDVRIPDEEHGTFVYPDAVYVCEPHWLREETAYLANPLLVVEVLSPSTAELDRTKKYRLYSSLPSVRAMLFVSSRMTSVEVYERRGEHIWLRTDVIGRGGEIRLEELNVVIPMSNLYERVKVGDDWPLPPLLPE